MPENEHFRVDLIWNFSRLTIDARNLFFYLADQVPDLLRRHVVFILDRLLLERLQVQDSIALLNDHVFNQLQSLKLHLGLLCFV